MVRWDTQADGFAISDLVRNFTASLCRNNVLYCILLTLGQFFFYF